MESEEATTQPVSDSRSYLELQKAARQLGIPATGKREDLRAAVLALEADRPDFSRPGAPAPGPGDPPTTPMEPPVLTVHDRPTTGEKVYERQPEVAHAVETITAVDNLGPLDVHPQIGLPMCLIRDKKRMAVYSLALGRTPEEAQSRREKIKLGRVMMGMYRTYRAFCENHGIDFWTERGFAACVVCYRQGAPVEQPKQEDPEDILAEIEGRG